MSLLTKEQDAFLKALCNMSLEELLFLRKLIDGVIKARTKGV